PSRRARRTRRLSRAGHTRTGPADRAMGRHRPALSRRRTRSRRLAMHDRPRPRAPRPQPLPRQDPATTARSEPAASVRADLPAGPPPARHPRGAARPALPAGGIDAPGGAAELLASELAANAPEHPDGPFTLALSRHASPGGRVGITCEVTDTSPRQPRPRQ